MAHVKESVHVHCPREVARELLCTMLLEGAPEGSPHPLLLAIKVPWTGIDLAKEVTVEYTVAAGTAHIDEPIGIRWKPLPGGVYPSFDGELRVLHSNHTYSSILELEGHYTPPLGVLGLGFDAAIGHKVAEATIKYLLEGFASGIMAEYRAEEWENVFSQVSGANTRSHVQVVSVTSKVEHLALPPPTAEEPA